MKKLCFVLLVLIASAGTSQAGVTVDRIDDINLQETTAVASFTTDGADMLGMVVTANGSDTKIWGELSTNIYGVQGSGWSLIENGDTYNSNWTLTTTGSTSLNSLLIDAGPGDTMFDTRSNTEYTPGSSIGREFELSASYYDDIAVTYRGPVSLTGQSFQTDLYRYMQIDFTPNFTGTLKFRADTDNAAFENDITPTVPAPGALVLAGLGTSLAGFLRRRRCV